MPSVRSQTWFTLPCRRRFLGLVLVAICGSALLAQTGTDDLPFTIQRIVVPPQRVAKELEKVQQGTLQSMPLQEFDARLERIRKALQARDQKPRLLRSHYSAELIDRALTNGSGQWTILHTGSADAILPIENLNLALHKVKWDHGGVALLGDFDDETLGLLLKQPGQQVCLFDWSARGASTSDGLSFALGVPACPVTTFELTLPADLWLAVPKSPALVSGPFDVATPGKRLWKVQVTGQTQLDFHVRKIAEPKGAVRAIFAQARTTQELAPNRVTYDFEFDVDILHDSVRELILDGDARLQPADVSLKSGDVKTWRWEQIAGKKDPKSKQPAGPVGQLTIEFRQPIQGKVTGLKVRALASLPTAGAWTSPGLRIRHSLSRGETLKIHVHPDLQPGKWDSGSFSLTNIATDTDGTQTITLADVPADSATAPRPSFLLSAGSVDLHTKESNHWRLDSRSALLVAEWNYAVLRGSLHQLTVKLPQKSLGYQVESIDLQPPDLLRGWHVTGNYLTVELKQALTVAKKATLKIGMRAPFRDIAGGARIVAYPDMEPWDSTKREGTLLVTVDRIFQAQLLSSSIPLARASDIAPAKSGDDVSYRFTFRDQAVGAVLKLVPQSVQVQLRGKQSIVLTEQGAAVQFRWEAEPLVGTPEFLDFRCTDRSFSSWTIKVDDASPLPSLRIHRWERLHLDEALPHLLHLGGGPGLNAAALEHALPGGAWWRFHLAEPLRKKSRFTLEATVPAGVSVDEWRRTALMLPSVHPWETIGAVLAAELLPKTAVSKAWSMPLLLPVQPLNVDYDITVESPREPIVKADAGGLRFVGAVGKLEQAPVHSLRYHVDHPPPRQPANLLLWTHPDQSAASGNELCDEAGLTTALAVDGRQSHHLYFRLWHWRDRTCTIRFSPGVEVVAAKLHDQCLELQKRAQ